MSLLEDLFGKPRIKKSNEDKESAIVKMYNRKFKSSLIGKWTSAEGTFAMMTDDFEFLENGKGTWLSSSSMGEREFKFDWREKADYTIEIREEGEENWIEIEYEFKIIEHDCGKEVILCQKNSEKFYLAVTRIAFCSGLK
ncbi:MAG: hypothetical protein IAF38_12065 [Bacteroidia bacterium]|nr:hypothetical protein [Bacteroidia bacterium]